MSVYKLGGKPNIWQLGLVLSAAVWLFGIAFVGPSDPTFNGWLLIFIYAFSIACIFRKNDRKAYPFLAFMIYCMLSNAGQTVTQLLGISNESNVDIYDLYSHELIGEMLMLQGIFVLCMTFGYLLFRRPRDISCALDKWNGDDETNTLGFGIEELVLLAVAAAVAVVYVEELIKRGSLSYGDYFYENREGVGTVMQYVYHVVVFAYLMRHRGKKRVMAYVILTVLAIMAILIGSRSALIPMLVGCVFVLMSSKRGTGRVKLRYILSVLIVLWIFAAFTELRNYAISELSFGIVAEVLALSPLRAVVNIVQEMGSSARTVLTTMDALNCGVISGEGTIIYSILKGIFPIGLLNLVGIDAPSIESLSAWVSEYGSGPYVDGQGWGYSIIGEIIYNFGGWGFIFSFVFGWLVAALENEAEKQIVKEQHFLAAGIIYLLGYAVFYARAESTLLSTRIRYTVYFALALIVIRSFRKQKRIGLKK